MGNGTPSAEQRFYSRYGFVQAHNDRNFGLIKIYRKKELNFDYVMVFEQRYSFNQLTQAKQQIESIRRSYTLQNDTSLLRILNAQVVKGGPCEVSCLRIFMQYLNFTLRDAIQQRKEMRIPFMPDEIMYVIQSALNAYEFLRKLNANHISLRPDTIFINPDGLIRFNPIRIDPFQSESEQCQCLPQSKQVYFQKTERQLLCQLKSMVLDLVEICPQDDFNFRKNYELLGNINHARTLNEVTTYLWVPQVDSLLPGKRSQTTDISSMGERQTKLMPFSMSNLTSHDSFSRQNLSFEKRGLVKKDMGATQKVSEKWKDYNRRGQRQ